MRLLKLTFILVIFSSCTTKRNEPVITWMYGYGQVEKLNGRVKKLIENKSSIDSCFTYIFNSKGDLIQTEYRNSTPIRYNTEYNSHQKMESIGLYLDSRKNKKEVYKYDSNGHIREWIGKADVLSPDTDRFLYNNAGDLIEHQQYFDKKPLWIFKFKYLYNKDSSCIGTVQSMTTWRDNFKKPEIDTTRHIAFDSNRNWIKAVNFLGDTITREITYY